MKYSEVAGAGSARRLQRNASSSALRSGGWRAAACVLAVLLATAGCSDFTEVEAPDVVQPSQLDNPGGALARRAGAIAQFAEAFSNQVVQSGVLADEFVDVGTGTFPSDRRVITLDNSIYPFAALSLARIDALRAARALEEYNPEPPARIGELFALAGFVDVMFGENLCSPVPLARIDGRAPLDAPELSRSELMANAQALFDSATKYGAASDTVQYLARLGSARASLVLDDVEAAAAKVATVPLNFRYQLPYSATIKTQVNRVFQATVSNRSLSVADRQGGNGLPFVSGDDPRVVAQLAGTGRNGDPLYNFVGYESLAAPITLATGIEASLIAAEAALRAQDIPAWLGALNHLRQAAITPAMPLLDADSTVDASTELRVTVMFRERAFWLFGTGRRHGDLRRLVRQYGRPVESVFPTGDYEPMPGLRYGSDVVFIPRGEEPNPAYTGCTDRAP